MYDTPWHAMFQHLLATPPCGAAMAEATLDAAVYHDPDRFQAERTRLFRRLPLCLGHADQLRDPGDMLARDIAGVPVLAIRDAAGEIGVFINACRHRGARLLGDTDAVCRKSSLTCRYHGWTYDLSGALTALPRRDAFPNLDRATRGLRRLPATVRHGLIWVVLDPARAEPPDMAGYLGDLDGDLAALGMERQKFFRQHAATRATNWKLIVDAFLEVYHVKRLHAGTIGPFFADARAASDHVGPHQRMLVARDNLAELSTLPPAQWSPRRHATLVHLIFPNSIIVYHPDYISHLGMFPTAPGETLFVHTMLIPEDPADDKAQAHWDRSFDLIDRQVFHAEDLHICEEIQRGFAAGTDETFLLGGFEGNVHRFHETIAAYLLAALTVQPANPPA